MFSTKSVLSCAAILLALSAQPAAAVPFTLEQTLNNPEPNGSDYFSRSVSVSGDGSIALVGADGDDVAGNRNAGSAYLVDTSTGGILQTLNTPNQNEFENLGFSVSLSSDGSTVLVGAPRGGADEAGLAYVFDASTGNLLRTLTSPDPSFGDRFGDSVSLSGDGRTALIGARNGDAGTSNGGSAYVIDTFTGNLLHTLNAPDPSISDQFGYSVSLSSDGSTALVGAYGIGTDGYSFAGAAYVFDASTGNLLQTLTSLEPDTNDFFGASTSLSSDGSLALIGAYGEDTGADGAGSAYVINTATGSVLQTIRNPDPDNNDLFGWSPSLSGDGSLALIGGANSRVGSAYLYDAASGALIQTLNNPGGSPRNYFGHALSLSGDGRTAVVGALTGNVGRIDAGTAYVYRDQAVDLPAPGSLLLLGSTLAVMAGLRLRRRRQDEG